MLRSLSTLTLAAVLLVGCNSPTLATRLSAKTITLVTLDQTEASVDDAQAIVTIAVMVKGLAGEDDLDTDALRAAIIEALVDQFSGQTQLIYVSIVDDLLSIVLEEIANRDPPLELGEAGIYINAAAIGVEQGATLYILVVESE